MMELGALQCVPKNPNCSDCPLKTQCLAFARGTVDERPVNTKKLQIKVRYFNYLVFKTDLNQTVLHKRDSNDIWKNLYDFLTSLGLKTLSVLNVPGVDTTKISDILFDTLNQRNF